jgi:predicted TIM-barrel fold metal-dependent hydrolase
MSALTQSANAAGKGYIDAHAHVWTADLKRYPIAAGYRPEQMKPPGFTPEELLGHAKPCGVSRIVLIQMSYYRFDNRYMLDAMESHPGVFGGVAIVDAGVPDADSRMRELKKRGVRGFRISPGRDIKTWLDTPGMAAMWRCGAEERLAICPLINPNALSSLDRMCSKFPDTPVVIDHFARIGADAPISESDVSLLCALARFRNVHVKVSAFYALGRKQYPYTDLLPMVRRLIDAYGPQRLMWATDCPYQVEDGHTYKGSLELVEERLDGISSTDRQWLLAKTAERVFFS